MIEAVKILMSSVASFINLSVLVATSAQFGFDVLVRTNQ